ncbi:phage head closure protein [Maledivibacter halophilus]|uniref:Phage head-tail adaptor, putative, SPP1 family n=1 Tax=Maledivibacter halophilus TaxID=36842 RepID=A0A1T5KFF4_9FIRM|nr:phage head closure protein [Maledivibacter halophilus]SKC62472.1 phage head-tail adaptor, putative, SPP1 family [Maledivibacter halophilus]
MDPGKLSYRITIQEKQFVEDKKTGIESKKWAAISRPWAKVQDIGGNEFFSSAKENNKIKTKFQIRYRKGLREDMRVIFNGKEYDITFIDYFDYNKKFMNLICECVK